MHSGAVGAAQARAEIVRVLDAVEDQQEGRSFDGIENVRQVGFPARGRGPDPGKGPLVVGPLPGAVQLVAAD